MPNTLVLITSNVNEAQGVLETLKQPSDQCRMWCQEKSSQEETSG